MVEGKCNRNFANVASLWNKRVHAGGSDRSGQNTYGQLEISQPGRDGALFKLAIDSKLRTCDPVTMENVRSARHMIEPRVFKGTRRPVQFEIIERLGCN